MNDLNEGFLVKNIAGCRVVFGRIPLSDMAMLLHGFSKNGVMATDIADKIGATLVVGEPEDVEQLRQMDLPLSEKRQREYKATQDQGRDLVSEWLKNGKRGASSNAMCQRIFGVSIDAGASHPLDPADLRHCFFVKDSVIQYRNGRDSHEREPFQCFVPTKADVEFVPD